MSAMDKLAGHIMAALRHALEGNGPASVRVIGKDSGEVDAVVFIVPAPAGEIVDEALNKLYAAMGWHTIREGRGEAN